MINDREHQSSNNNVINQNELDQFMEKVLTDLGIGKDIDLLARRNKIQ